MSQTWSKSSLSCAALLAAALLAAAALIAVAPGCPNKETGDGNAVDGALPGTVAPAEAGLPPGWNPTAAEISAAPEQAWSRIDIYTVRFSPEPTREILAKKARVFELAVKFFKGSKSESDSARAELSGIGIPTAKYLVELGGLIVPKASRPVPPPDSWDIPESPEDKALEVVKDIQERFLKEGDVPKLMSYFVAATGKSIDLDAKFFEMKREFRSFRVHPVPALWRVGDELGCDTGVIAPDATMIPLFLPVLFDMNVHGEDVRWLLESMARLGGFEAELAPEVSGPVGFRVRAETYRDAFCEIARFAGFDVTEKPGGFRVVKRR